MPPPVIVSAPLVSAASQPVSSAVVNVPVVGSATNLVTKNPILNISNLTIPIIGA